MQIYLSCGYTERDAAHSIAHNNLWGLDLDKRAYQLAYFAVMMKVRQYDRRLWYRITELKTFDAHLPNLSHFQDLPNPNYALLDEPIRLLAMQFEKGREEGIRLGNIEGLFVTYKIMKKKMKEVQANIEKCTDPKLCEELMKSANILEDSIREIFPHRDDRDLFLKRYPNLKLSKLAERVLVESEYTYFLS